MHRQYIGEDRVVACPPLLMPSSSSALTLSLYTHTNCVCIHIHNVLFIYAQIIDEDRDGLAVEIERLYM
jgi:hypothetical protein